MAPAARADDWTYLSGLVAAREAHMLPEAFFRQLAAEEDLAGVLQRLGDTAFQDRLGDAVDVQRLDAVAQQAFGDCLAEVRALSPSDDAVFGFDVQAAIEDVRSFVRNGAEGAEAPGRRSGYDDEAWQRLGEGLPADVPDYLQEAMSRAQRAAEEFRDRPEVLDAQLDSLCLSALCAEAQRRDNAFVAGYWERFETARGVEALWRARALGLGPDVEGPLARERRQADLFDELARLDLEDWPDVLRRAAIGLDVGPLGEEAGAAGVRAFAKAADEALTHYARRGREVAFGPQRVFGYLVGMQAEVFNLKVVVGGRSAGVAPELLGTRLRACYV